MECRIKLDELKDAISNMKFGKASGPDNILAEYLRYATTNVVKALLELMNVIFTKTLYPSGLYTKKDLQKLDLH